MRASGCQALLCGGAVENDMQPKCGKHRGYDGEACNFSCYIDNKNNLLYTM